MNVLKSQIQKNIHQNIQVIIKVPQITIIFSEQHSGPPIEEHSETPFKSTQKEIKSHQKPSAKIGTGVLTKKANRPHKQMTYDEKEEEDSSQEQHMSESSFVTLDKSLELNKEQSEDGDTEIICSSKLNEEELVPVYIKQSKIKNFKL